MKSPFKGIRLRFFLFATSIGLSVVAFILIVRSNTNLLLDDSNFLAKAASESILTQRVANLTFIIDNEVNREEVILWRLDTLSSMLNELTSCHEVLLKMSKAIKSGHSNDSLLASMTPFIQSTVETGRALIRNPQSIRSPDALSKVEVNDQVLTQSIRRVLAAQQIAAENNIVQFHRVQGIMGILVFLLSVIGIAGVVYPVFKRIRDSNTQLQIINEKLSFNQSDFNTGQDEVNKNLEHIKALKSFLEDKERHYREVIEGAGDFIYEVDQTGFCLYVNPSMIRTTGFDKSVLIGNPYWKIIHPAHRDRVTGLYNKQIAAGDPNSYIEFPIVVQSGRSLWLGQSAHMSFHENGSFIKSSFIARDITELKNARQEFEKTDKLYKLISTNSQDLICIFEDDGTLPICTYVSPSVTKMLGFDPDEILGEDPFQFIHPEDLPNFMTQIYPATQRGESTVSQYRHSTKAGGYLWMESFASPIYDEDGEQTGYQTTDRDIATRREAERKLIEAKERAEEAAVAKSQFLSMMSHEIRTPMNGVIGLTNFLLEKDPRPDQLKHLRLLKFSGENLVVIINDILDFNKIEAGKINLDLVAFDLRAFIQNVLSTLEHRASDKGISLVLEFDEKLPKGVKADPVRIHQVLNNLVGNAIKFTAYGSVRLTVEHLGIEEGAHEIAFAVKDTGIGIPSEYLLKIFEPFSQGSIDTTRKFGGTGLGLAITRRLLLLMDSDISVESSAGNGSTFSFTLLLESATVRPADQVHNQSGFNTHGGANVLLVEDNDVNQVVASNYLELWKFNVTIANNGVEALKLIQQKIFHLVLMDIQMPLMNGYECTRQIRELPDPYFKNVPIIALTASATGEDIAKLGEIGLNDYITKPFDPQDLHDKIFRHFTNGEGMHTAVAPGKLDQFSNGNASTNVVLAERMIGNLKFLVQAIEMSLSEDNIEIFLRAHHQVKTTISILGDDNFTSALEDLKTKLKIGADDPAVKEHVEDFRSRCEDKITELSSFIMSMK
ncbi:MAG: PAS domain S-box protein [Chryseolinea sp.]